MSPQEAELIINQFGAALASGTDGGIARKISRLPCSIGRIRYAYFVYLEVLASRGALTASVDYALRETYHALSYFIADPDADMINAIHARLKSCDDSALPTDDLEVYKRFINHTVRNSDILEFNSYLNECLGKRDNQDFILPEYRRT